MTTLFEKHKTDTEILDGTISDELTDELDRFDEKHAKRERMANPTQGGSLSLPIPKPMPDPLPPESSVERTSTENSWLDSWASTLDAGGGEDERRPQRER